VLAHHDDQCFGCGSQNDHGLRLRFVSEGDAIAADVRFDQRHLGPPGLVHGGLIATVLDEALAQWPPRLEMLALTRELSVRYERKVRPDTPLRVTARVLARAGRTVELEAELREPDGRRVAYARAVFETITPRSGGAPGAAASG
jgi:uncharacterized protein (TIGR00369 family)